MDTYRPTPPHVDSAGPRRPIRVDRCEAPHTPQGAPYLTRLGLALEAAFSLTFAACENGGRQWTESTHPPRLRRLSPITRLRGGTQ